MAQAGRVLMIPAGDWTSGSNYGMLDVVVHNGSSYVAKKNMNNSTQVPPEDTENWQLIAQGVDVSNIVTKSMMSGIDANDANKVPNSAFIHTLFERIGMGTALSTGANLTDAFNQLNSDVDVLNTKANFECIKIGSEIVTPNAEGEISIVFDRPFEKYPKVFASLRGNSVTVIPSVKFKSVLLDGFTAVILINDNGTISVPRYSIGIDWMAMT